MRYHRTILHKRLENVTRWHTLVCSSNDSRWFCRSPKLKTISRGLPEWTSDFSNIKVGKFVFCEPLWFEDCKSDSQLITLDTFQSHFIALQITPLSNSTWWCLSILSLNFFLSLTTAEGKGVRVCEHRFDFRCASPSLWREDTVENSILVGELPRRCIQESTRCHFSPRTLL